MGVSVSVVIPTHNRKDMLRRVLDMLEKQTYGGEMEYVVVLDGCVDGTREMLSEIDLRRPLRTVELPGMGAATARNNGARAASGDYIVFIDDDVIPSATMVAEHMKWHKLYPDTAVIGACPFGLGTRIGRLGQYGRDWWHAQYQLMASQGHTSTYRDFLTGNASISRQTFLDLQGFDEGFRLAGREDFEFGLRLLQSGQQIRFNPEAYGCHYPGDGFGRAMKRCWVQGKADVILVRKHPSVMQFTDLATLRQRVHPVTTAATWVAFHLPRVGDALAWIALRCLILGRAVIRQKTWLRLSGLMMCYYYYRRGVRDELSSLSELDRLAGDSWMADPANCRTRFERLDLSQGLSEIGEIENCRSICILVTVGDESLGWVEVRPVGGKSCISREELSQAITDQIWWRFWQTMTSERDRAHPWRHSHRSMSWDSLSEALSSFPVSTARKTDPAQSAEDYVVLAEGDCEPDPLWTSAVQELFRDSSVAAVAGLVAPRTVDTRADELLVEMSALKRRLWNWQPDLASAMRPTRAALELESGCHWLAVRKRLLDRLALSEADRNLPMVLRRILVQGHKVVYQPSAVMWRPGGESRRTFRQTLAESRFRLGTLAVRALVSEPGSRAETARAVMRWLGWRAKRGVKWMLRKDAYPATACAAEVCLFVSGMLSETGRMLAGRLKWVNRGHSAP